MCVIFVGSMRYATYGSPELGSHPSSGTRTCTPSAGPITPHAPLTSLPPDSVLPTLTRFEHTHPTVVERLEPGALTREVGGGGQQQTSDGAEEGLEVGEVMRLEEDWGKEPGNRKERKR